MKIGFVGAGKVGFTLGKYFSLKGYSITGYYDINTSFAVEAGEFTGSKCFEDINELLADCDTLFLTVPDTFIIEAYSFLDKNKLKGKLICHCSGVMSGEEAFPDADHFGAYVCSVHPLLAVSSKYDSYREIAGGFFAVEGTATDKIEELLKACGNDYQIIDATSKHRYHCASAVASNLVVGLMDVSISMLESCGFSREGALKALNPIMTSNIAHISKYDVKDSLTGPVERGDSVTVEKHLNTLCGKEKDIYILLSRRILKIAQNKNPDRDYSKLTEMLKGE